MGIDARWENEKGAALETLDDPQNLVARFLPNHTDAEFACLRFVDLYGDTVFNQLQLPQLLKELRSIAERPFDAAVHHHLAALIGLVQKASGHDHSYICFYGN